MSSLVDLFRNTVNDSLVRQTADQLGESQENTSTAVNAVFPALLSALVTKGNTESGARSLLDYMSGNNLSGSIIKDLPTIMTGGPEMEILKANGADILKFLIGDRVSPLIDSVASRHGLRTSSASNLLKIIATLLMTSLARVVGEKNMHASELRDYLDAQKEYLTDNVPSDYNEIMNIPGEYITGTADAEPFHTTNQQTTLSKLLPWIVLLIAALGLFYFLEKGSNPPPEPMKKENIDSLNNVRRIDSLRNQAIKDSIANSNLQDTISGTPDSIQ